MSVKENEEKRTGTSGPGVSGLPPAVRRYADIIGLEHPVSRKHPQMQMADRAAQFSPFAALTGYGDLIDHTADEYMEQVAREIMLEAAEDI